MWRESERERERVRRDERGRDWGEGTAEAILIERDLFGFES